MISTDLSELNLPEPLFGTIKKVGMLNKEPILYGDPNLLKNGDLYYIIPLKTVFRYVACHTFYEQAEQVEPTLPLLSGDNKSTEVKHHDFLFIGLNETENNQTIAPDTGVFDIAEEERGTIKKVGYLFDKPIYSGDPSLVKDNQLFYHPNLYTIVTLSVDSNCIKLKFLFSDKKIESPQTIDLCYYANNTQQPKDNKPENPEDLNPDDGIIHIP